MNVFVGFLIHKEDYFYEDDWECLRLLQGFLCHKKIPTTLSSWLFMRQWCCLWTEFSNTIFIAIMKSLIWVKTACHISKLQCICKLVSEMYSVVVRDRQTDAWLGKEEGLSRD